MRGFLAWVVVIAALAAATAFADQPAADVASFEALDRNHTGKLEGEEAKVVETVGETPAAVDADEDGKVDRAEFESAVAGTTGSDVRIAKPKDEATDEEEAAE